MANSSVQPHCRSSGMMQRSPTAANRGPSSAAAQQRQQQLSSQKHSSPSAACNLKPTNAAIVGPHVQLMS
ncbi:hypothetical protein Dimus_027118 [Dionaea muscipula]